MSDFGGPRRRVATSRKRSGSHSGRDVDKRIRSGNGDQSLVTVGQRCDETDAGLTCESFVSSVETQGNHGTTPTKLYSQHSDIKNATNKRPLFQSHQHVSSQKLLASQYSGSIVTATQRDEAEWKSSHMVAETQGGCVEGFEDEWAEDEFRAEDDLFGITSTPSSSHRQVIQPETVCSNLSPVIKPASTTGPTNMAIDMGEDWDGEDSMFEKLDLSKIVAESQGASNQNGCQNAESQGASNQNGCQNAVSQGASNQNGCQNDLKLSGIDEAGDNSAIKSNNIQNNDSQFDSISTLNDGNNKCSIVTNSVRISSNTDVRAENEQLSTKPSTSVTPAQEKWFSHIEGSIEMRQNPMAQNLNMSRTSNQGASISNHDGFSPLPQANLQRTPNHNDSNNPNVIARTNSIMKTPIVTKSAYSSTTPSNTNITPNRRQPCETPQSTIANRLKQRLQRNAKIVTPVQNRAAQLRKASIDVAMSEAMEVQDRVADKDVGPFYGLPSKVQELLKVHRGIEKLYDWQHSCLTLPAIQQGHNLIYSLPTSGGKTLVAEILIMQQLLGHKMDAILVVPYVAIVQEKVTNLSVFAVELGFLVEEYAGSKGAIPPRKRRKKRTLYIATIEKAHSLVNSLIQEQRIANVGLVVVDELHMLGDGSRRGATLEMCLSKLLYTKASQIIGMSATLSNIQDLCTFMKADLYTSDFRPVELKEYVKVEDNIFEVQEGTNLQPDEKFVHARTVTFPYSKALTKVDPDHLIGLALEVIPDFSCLIFCATKKNCQNVAEIICKHMPRDFAKKIMAHKAKDKKELLQSLRRECDNHLCSTLKRTVPYGVAYHHSGLTMDERKLVEDAYSEGTLCLLTCTSTLAAGVNLPAKRVILRSPYIAKDLLTTSRYKQMVGRAGRAGIDTSGESIMIIKAKEQPQITEMLSGPLEGCYSSLMHDEGKGLRGLVLTLVALKITQSRQSVIDFMQHTLFGVQTQESEQDLADFTHNALQQLIDVKLVKDKVDPGNEADSLEVTRLGQAAFKGSIDIDLCSTVYRDLKFACDQGLVLANSLHLLYLVTPYDAAGTTQPNWMIYNRQYSRLGDAERKVSDMIGVTELYLSSKITGKRVRADDNTVFQVQRFYLTLMLWNLLNEKSLWDVATRFDVPRGFIQNLFASAASFASSVQRFCEDLSEFWAFQQLLARVVHDLTYLATSDLVSLLEVPGVKQGRAKQLVKTGYKTLRHLAHADPDVLVQEVDHLPRKIALQIVSAAKMELAERAEALREEAEELASKPIHNVTQE